MDARPVVRMIRFVPWLPTDVTAQVPGGNARARSVNCPKIDRLRYIWSGDKGRYSGRKVTHRWHTGFPMTGTLYRHLVGQEQAVASLEAAARRPVHAYLFVGPPGAGKAAAASSFAASLLCPATFAVPPGPPDGTCETCRRVLGGVHPDVVHVERVGASIDIGTARQVIRAAVTSPVEGDRKVLILHDFHLVSHTGPALLKTIEEPPPTTIFVILAEYLPPELVTIASRCVRVDFVPLTTAQVAEALEADGVDGDRATELAAASGGRLDRARLLASDSQFEARRLAWRQVPARLDGTGATVAVIADELMRYLDDSVQPLKDRHADEMQGLMERNERAAEVVGSGKRGRSGGSAARATRAALNAGVKDLEERQRREQRRQRTDELRAGLAALASSYRDRMVTAPDTRRRAEAIEAVGHIDRLARDLEFNPGELLAIQALLVRLNRTGVPG